MIPFELYSLIFKKRNIEYSERDKCEDYLLEAAATLKIREAILKKLGQMVSYSDIRVKGKGVYINNSVYKFSEGKFNKFEEEDYKVNAILEGQPSFFRRIEIDIWKIVNNIHEILYGIEHVMDNEFSEEEYEEKRELFLTECIEGDVISNMVFKDVNELERIIPLNEQYLNYFESYVLNIRHCLEHLSPKEIKLFWNSAGYDMICRAYVGIWETGFLIAPDIFILPVKKDWQKYKQKVAVEESELVRRAEYLFSLLDDEYICHHSVYEEDVDQVPLLGFEGESPFFGLFIKETDEVISKLNEKYRFTNEIKEVFY